MGANSGVKTLWLSCNISRTSGSLDSTFWVAGFVTGNHLQVVQGLKDLSQDPICPQKLIGTPVMEIMTSCVGQGSTGSVLVPAGPCAHSVVLESTSSPSISSFTVEGLVCRALIPLPALLAPACLASWRARISVESLGLCSV